MARNRARLHRRGLDARRRLAPGAARQPLGRARIVFSGARRDHPRRRRQGDPLVAAAVERVVVAHGKGPGLMDASLERLARLYGIEPGYHDIWGQWKATPEASAVAILAAMGVDAHDHGAGERMLAAEERAEGARAVPAVTVLRAHELASGVRIHLLEASLDRPLAWRITGEGGEIREEAFTPVKLPVLEDREGAGWRARALALPLP